MLSIPQIEGFVNPSRGRGEFLCRGNIKYFLRLVTEKEENIKIVIFWKGDLQEMSKNGVAGAENSN